MANTTSTAPRSLKGLVPLSVRHAVRTYERKARAAAHGPRAQVELRAVKRSLRQRYGDEIVFTVAPDDEMFHFMRDSWSWPHHVIPMRAPSDAMRTYLASGDVMMTSLEKALRDQGRDLAQMGSFLEFASGFGRFTRFLVRRVPAHRVTVSDISRPAVDFAVATFGVKGEYSAESATDFADPGGHDVIFVASLFSHLTIEHWGPWLARLYAGLAPGGLLVFSTHGPYARDVIYGEGWRHQLTAKAEGFDFLETNETNGRLAPAYYGSAFVTEDFVRRQVADLGLGELRQMYPTAMWGSQDLYVIEKPAAATAPER